MKQLLNITVTILLSLIFCTDIYAKKEDNDNVLTTFLESYEGRTKVEFVNLKGILLNFAKPALKNTPMKNIVDKVDNLCVFSMSGASKDELKSFDMELDGILAGYEKVAQTRDGNIESTIYLKKKDDAFISEIVVYSGNEDIAIVVMRGEIPIELLEEMATQMK